MPTHRAKVTIPPNLRLFQLRLNIEGTDDSFDLSFEREPTNPKLSELLVLRMNVTHHVHRHGRIHQADIVGFSIRKKSFYIGFELPTKHT